MLLVVAITEGKTNASRKPFVEIIGPRQKASRVRNKSKEVTHHGRKEEGC
jgi:hypothetical protein